jgi:hypothetical protein
MRKENKIVVVVDPDPEARRQMIARIAIKMGFARTVSDAMKIIQVSPFDYDLSLAYFVLAGTFDFKSSPIVTQKLFEMASKGQAVVVGSKRLPREYEFFCNAYFKEDF